MENYLFIGNYADSDTNESDRDAENLGVFPTTPIDGSILQIVAMNQTDTNSNGGYGDSELGLPGEPASYDLGAGTVTTAPDMTTGANITVTLGDGTTRTFLALLVQMDNGDTFLRVRTH
ncbi:hypothetical protein J7382_11440 [Shimia sp. R11_0]|uniref:hypothetical protein n=1 Tax=Shimia sp. R11_0 TaxID=2821096 RepID=UPI001ADB4757|nr:hypothetical protein [Shimia sp. R11_0]MBO9478149.1 hypothetical protein [Shimia sp. R11_0]